MRTEIDPGPAADFLQGWKTGYKDAAGTDAIRITPPGSKRYLRMECADGVEGDLPGGRTGGDRRTARTTPSRRHGQLRALDERVRVRGGARNGADSGRKTGQRPGTAGVAHARDARSGRREAGGRQGTDNHRMISAAVGETGIEHAGVSGTPARVLIPVALAEQFLKTRRDGDADAEAPERLTAATAERGTRVRIEYAGTVWIAHGEGGGGWFPAAPDDRTGCGLKYTSVEVETRDVQKLAGSDSGGGAGAAGTGAGDGRRHDQLGRGAAAVQDERGEGGEPRGGARRSLRGSGGRTGRGRDPRGSSDGNPPCRRRRAGNGAGTGGRGRGGRCWSSWPRSRTTRC